MAPIQAVVFDAGETLFNEDRLWALWAAWMDVSPESLFKALREAIAERRDHRSAFTALRPEFDLEAERQKRSRTGEPARFRKEDLYPDALTTLGSLKDWGYTVGVAGNHPRGFADVLLELEPRIDFIASSDEWGIRKPSSTFFEHIVKEVSLPPQKVAYVGDRLDNDVIPAVRYGMAGIFLRRGPWAEIQKGWPESSEATAQINDLSKLLDILPKLGVESDGRPAAQQSASHRGMEEGWVRGACEHRSRRPRRTGSPDGLPLRIARGDHGRFSRRVYPVAR